MEHSAVFARHFARLVGLLVTEGSSVDEQKVSLRAALQFAREGSVLMAREERRVLCDGAIVSDVFPGVKEFGARLLDHGVRELHFAKDAAAVEVLGVARLLAGPFVQKDGGRNFHALLGELGVNTVTITTDVRLSVSPEEEEEEEEVEEESPLAQVRSVLSDAQRSSRSHVDLLERLARKKTTTGVAKSLEKLGTLAEQYQREGKFEAVTEVFLGIIEHEGHAPTPDAKRAYIQMVRRLAKPPLLNGVARLIRRNSEQREPYVTILSRVGEDGALAVFRQIISSPTLHDRTVYFSVLRQLIASVPALIHTLVDERWYIVRAASDLLGEIAAEEAESGIIGLLQHDDDRVRRSGVQSLGRLGTFRAIEALKRALKDASAQVRAQAVFALGAQKDVRLNITLAAALDEEVDEEVQFALISAIGRVGGMDAVQRLARAAGPEGGRIFKASKKSQVMRVAAIQALALVRSQAAVLALKELAQDRDKEVRDAAQRALAGVRSTPSGSMRAVTPISSPTAQ